MTSDLQNEEFENQGRIDPASAAGAGDLQDSRFEAVVATLVFLVAVGALVFFLNTIFRSLHDVDAASEESASAADEASVSSEEGMPLRSGPIPGIPVRGIVTRANGAPAHRALVELSPVGNPGWGNTLRAETGKDGSFEIGTPFPGVFRIQASLETAVDWIEPVSPGERVSLILNPAVTVTVRVANLPADREAAASLVRIHPSPLPGRASTCRREGDTFVFEKTTAGAYRLAIQTEDSFVEHPVDCLGEGDVSLTVEIPPPMKLEGVARDAFGRPVPDARVTAFSSSTGLFVTELRTGAKGFFSFKAPQGRYRLDVEAAGFVPAAVPMAAPGSFQDVTLARGTLWHGSVVDRAGSPVKSARIRVIYSIAHLPGERIRDLGVAEDGTFSWRSAGGQGERFHVSAPGFGPRCFENVLPPFAPSEPEEKKLKPFELIPAETSLGGVVQNRHGGAVAGLRLCLVSAGLPRTSPFYREWFEETDGAGLFQFPEVASGEYRILIDGHGFARSSRPVFLSGDTIVNILAEVGRRISGTVRGQGDSLLPGVEVILTGGSREYIVLTDSAGRFSFADVPPDSVMLRVRGGGKATLDSWDDGTLVLPEGGILASRIMDGNGSPVRLFQAAPVFAGESVDSSRAVWIKADGGGRFRLSLPARPERILFRRNGYRDLLIPGKSLVRHGESYCLPDNEAVVLEWAGGS